MCCTFVYSVINLIWNKQYVFFILSIMAFSKTTISLKSLCVTLYKLSSSQVSFYWLSHFNHCNAECRYAECHFAERRGAKTMTLNNAESRSAECCGATYGCSKNLLGFSGLYYKPMTIVNDDARIVNKLDASLTDDARVVIYNRHMLIVQTTGLKCWFFKTRQLILLGLIAFDKYTIDQGPML